MDLPVQRQKNILSQDDINRTVWISSYADKYIFADNLDKDSKDTQIDDQDHIFNNTYQYIIAVTQGSMNLLVNKQLLQINANDYLLITPFTSIEILFSNCCFFMMAVESFIMNDIRIHLGMEPHPLNHCCSFKQIRFQQEQMALLIQSYLNAKREMKRAYEVLKEKALIAAIEIHTIKFLAIQTKGTPINKPQNSASDTLFKEFCSLFSQNYLHYRKLTYYAQSLGVNPKALSNAITKHVGIPASQYIECYMTERIKQVLYSGESSNKDTGVRFGFPTQSFFGRYFHKITGIFPKDFITINNKKTY